MPATPPLESPASVSQLSPSVLGREERLRAELVLEDLVVCQAALHRRAHHAAVDGEDNVLERSVELFFLE